MRKIEEMKYNNTPDMCGKCGSNHIIATRNSFSGKHFWLWFAGVLGIGALFGLSAGIFGTEFGILGMITGILGAIIPALIIGVIAGFAGQAKIVNNCTACGNHWEPGK